MTRSRVVAGLVALVGLMAPTTTLAADGLEIREGGEAVFPDRSYVVTLPERRALTAADVVVTENGEPVHDVRVLGGPATRSGVVLAIDASTSMRGRPMKDAMAAARAFARRRRPEQKLGVVFFSREPWVALPPTTDAAKIDAALSVPPPISTGTRILDATKAAIELLRTSDVATGSVVVLSDGCRAAGGRCVSSVGGAVTAREVAEAAAARKTRVFSVGLRSRTYDAATLRSLATDGDYIEAARSKDLSSIFGRLGTRFGNEYLLVYRSLSPVGARIGVGIEIDGVKGVATAAYQTPDLRIGRADSFVQKESLWRSPTVSFMVAVVVVLLAAMAVLLVIRGRRRTLEERISSFVFTAPGQVLKLPDKEARGLLTAVDEVLSHRAFWRSFKLDVEIARLKWPAVRIAATSLLGVLLAVGVCVLLGRPVVGVMLMIVLPVVVRMAVGYLARRWRIRFAEQLPDNLQVMSSALRAGHSFVGALKTMVDDAPEPSVTEYRRVLSDEQLGIPIEESLNVVSARMKNEEVSYVGLIATLQRETGGNTAEVLDRVTITVRERMKLRRLVRTLTAQGRAGGYIVTALPIAMLVFLNVVKPDYMDPMLATTAGWIVLIAAGLMVVAGAFVIRKIVDIDV